MILDKIYKLIKKIRKLFLPSSHSLFKPGIVDNSIKASPSKSSAKKRSWSITLNCKTLPGCKHNFSDTLLKLKFENLKIF